MSTWQAALQLRIIRVPNAVMRTACHSHGARSFTDGACHDLVLFIHYSESKSLCEETGRAFLSQSSGLLKLMKGII